MKSIYKNDQAKKLIYKTYDEKLNSLGIQHESLFINTSHGKTHVVSTGNSLHPPLVVFHGINAGAPLALEAIKNLNKNYRIIAIDTLGQTTKSDENRLPLNDSSIADWINEVLNHLKINQAYFIGISYGGFLLQKFMKHYPHKIIKAILVVPGGICNGRILASITKLSFPLLRYLVTKKDKHLQLFLNAFVDGENETMFQLQKIMLLQTKMDYRRPPLLKKKDVENLEAPVYLMISDNDVFFPGEKTLEISRSIFKNFKDHYVLKTSKHIPNANQFPEIEKKVEEWLSN